MTQVRKKTGPKRGSKNPNAGRPTLSETGGRVQVNVTLDPDLHKLVRWHTRTRGNNFSQSLNILLDEALKLHEIDEAAKEVL